MMFANGANELHYQDHTPRKWSTTVEVDHEEALKVFLQHRIRTVISKEWWDFVVNVNNMNSDHASLLYSVANLCPSFQHFLKSRDKEIMYVLKKRPVIKPRIFSGSERIDVQPLTFPSPPKETPPPKKSCSTELDKILNELYPNDKSIFKRKQRLSGPASRQRKTPAIKFKSAYPPKEPLIEHTDSSSTLLAKLLREDHSSVTALTANNRLAPPKQNTSFRSPVSTSSKENKNHKVEYAVSDYDFNRNKVSMNIKKIKKIIKIKRKRYFYTDKSSPIRYNLEDETPELKLELIKRYKIKKCSVKLEKLTPKQIKNATRPRLIIYNGSKVITSSDVCRSDDKTSAPPQTVNGEHNPSTSHRPWEDEAIPPEHVKNILEAGHIASHLNHEISKSVDKTSVLPQTMNCEQKPSTSHRPWVDEAISAEHVTNTLEEGHIASQATHNICRSAEKIDVLPETMNCEQKPSTSHGQLPGNEATPSEVVKNNLEERHIPFQPNQDISKLDIETSAVPQTLNGEHKPTASHSPLSGDEAISREFHENTLKEKCSAPQPNSDMCGSNDKTSVLPQTVNGEHVSSASPTPLVGKEAILSELEKSNLMEKHVVSQPNHEIRRSDGKVNAQPQTENDEHKPPTSHRTLADNAANTSELVKNTFEEKHNIPPQPSPDNLISHCNSIIPEEGTAEGNNSSMILTITSESGPGDSNVSAVIKYHSDEKENVEVAEQCKPKDLMDLKTVYCHGGIVPLGKKISSNEKPSEKLKHFLSLKEKKIKVSVCESRDPVSSLKEKCDQHVVNVELKSNDVHTISSLKSGDKSSETLSETPDKCITDAEFFQGKCASVSDSPQSLDVLSEKEGICVSDPVSQKDDSRIEEAEDKMEDSLVIDLSPDEKQDLILEDGPVDCEENKSTTDVELNKCTLLEDRTNNTNFEEALKESLENNLESHKDHTESQDLAELPQEVYSVGSHTQDDHIESQDETDSEEDEVRSPHHHTELDVDHSSSQEDYKRLEEDHTGLHKNYAGPQKEPAELRETIGKDSIDEMELNLTESSLERSEACKKSTDSGICDMSVLSPSTEMLTNGESCEKESLSGLINTDEPQNDNDEHLSEPLAKRPRIEVNLTEMKIELTKPPSEIGGNLKNDFSCRLCKQTFYSLIDWLSHFDNEVPKCTPNLHETCDRPEVPMLN